jgi:hypothetical protein
MMVETNVLVARPAVVTGTLGSVTVVPPATFVPGATGTKLVKNTGVPDENGTPATVQSSPQIVKASTPAF